MWEIRNKCANLFKTSKNFKFNKLKLKKMLTLKNK